MAKQLQEDLDKLLECPVCLEQIKEPKMLKCQHSFCSKPCLENMIEKRSKITGPRSKIGFFQVQCALCRKTHRYNSLDDIPDNFQMKNMLEIRQKPVESRNQSQVIKDGTYGIDNLNL